MLVMIVKNEMEVLPRCFDSVKDYISCYSICDTGSTDGTQNILRNIGESLEFQERYIKMRGRISGIIVLMLLRGVVFKVADYMLLMDADFIFIPKDPNFRSKIPPNADGFLIRYEGGLDYRQMFIY